MALDFHVQRSSTDAVRRYAPRTVRSIFLSVDLAWLGSYGLQLARRKPNPSTSKYPSEVLGFRAVKQEPPADEAFASRRRLCPTP